MQQFRRALIAVVGALALAACAGPVAGPKADPAADEAAVRAIVPAWYEAYAAGDAAAMAERLYAEEAVMHPPGAPEVRGRAAISEFIAKDMAASKAAGLTIANDSSVDVKVGVSGDLAWITNGFVVTAPDGSKVDVGKSVTVMARRGDSWKALQEQWNSNAPAAVGGKVLRIVRFTVSGAEAQQAVMKLAGEELSPLYAKAKGFQWVKYFTDAKTLTVGSVTAWDSAADVEAFIQSENYQAFLVKLKPSMKGPLASNVYEVQAPPTN